MMMPNHLQKNSEICGQLRSHFLSNALPPNFFIHHVHVICHRLLVAAFIVFLLISWRKTWPVISYLSTSRIINKIYKIGISFVLGLNMSLDTRLSRTVHTQLAQ